MNAQQDIRSGMLLAVAGFAVLSLGDAVVKSMAGEWPPVAVAALRFSMGALGLAAILWRQEGSRSFWPSKPWLQLARGLCVAIASLSFFSAIYIMPLAETMAITFMAPVFTALLSGPLLGEKVKPVVWSTCGIAMIGVVLILRPNLLSLGPGALLPLLSAIFFSLLIILNRASAGQGSPLAMQFFIAATAAPILIVGALAAKVSGIEALDFGWPSWDVVARCALVAVTATIAHWLAYLGTTKAGAAQVAPASYVQMLVATALGWLWFGDVPDLITVVGATIIIGAGLILWRSQVTSSKGTSDAS